MRLFFLLTTYSATAAAFSVVPESIRSRRSSTVYAPQASVLRSEPSDTSSDSYTYIDETDIENGAIDVEEADYEPTKEERIVNNVMDLLPKTLFGDDSATATHMRAQMNELLLQLESMNPTMDPAISPLLNGVWELKYAGGYASDWTVPSPTRQLALFLYSGGYSPGMFALQLARSVPFCQVGSLEIAISRQQPRVEASVELQVFGGVKSQVQVQARLEPTSGLRLREVYERASVGDQAVALPNVLQYARDLYVTYVDEDLLVVRDASGVPELLVRKEKMFKPSSMGTEPSSLADMVPPGEGEEFLGAGEI